MSRALELAAQGRRTTQPNPRVGCVITKEELIIAEGWHQRAGELHAEVLALRAAGAAAHGATAFVTLEPCNHFGRTPPCSEALIAAGIKRVIYAVGDPNPQVDGSGAARLQAAGIQVQFGLLGHLGEELNLGFFSRMRRSRPWVRLKLAASLDGRTALANGKSQWITSTSSRADVHEWRAESAAILSTSSTVLADDPELTARIPESTRQPLRLILDSQFRVSANARVFNAAAPSVRLTVRTAQLKQSVHSMQSPRSIALESDAQGYVALPAALAWMAKEGLNEIWTEAGPTLAGALVRLGLADELVLYLAPCLLGPDAQPLVHLPVLSKLIDASIWHVQDLRQMGSDIRIMLRQGE